MIRHDPDLFAGIKAAKRNIPILCHRVMIMRARHVFFQWACGLENLVGATQQTGLSASLPFCVSFELLRQIGRDVSDNDGVVALIS